MSGRRADGRGTAGPIRIQVLSDLHAERDRDAVPHPSQVATGADIVVLAGDVARAPDSVAIASALFPEALGVILVGGNHDHYRTGVGIDEGLEFMSRAAFGHSSVEHRTVAALEDEEVVVEVRGVPVRFLGATLWTDYALFGDAVRDSRRVSGALNDYKAFKGRVQNPLSRFLGGGDDPVTTSELLSRHKASVEFLRAGLARPHDGPTVVITHHLPSLRSVVLKYKRDVVTAGFASNLDDLVAMGATLWVHGHTHTSRFWRDRAGGTLVACNPMGYSRPIMGGRDLENRDFDPRMVIDLRRGAPDGAWRAGRERKRT